MKKLKESSRNKHKSIQIDYFPSEPEKGVIISIGTGRLSTFKARAKYHLDKDGISWLYETLGEALEDMKEV